MGTERAAGHRARKIAIAVAVAAIVVVGVVVAVVASQGRHPSAGRGAATAQAAAKRFVDAVNSGSGPAAAAVSCSDFADQARGLARSGLDSGISFTLGTVTTAGSAELKESLDVGGSRQTTTYLLTLRESAGRWLVCGQR